MSGEPLIPLIHNVCGKPALWATVRPVAGERPTLSELRLKDGSTPLAGSRCACASCGALVGPGDVRPEGGFAHSRDLG